MSDDDEEPNALFALPGLDPHSGGFAVDVTFLLLGGASTIALTLLTSALARAHAGETVEVVGATKASAGERTNNEMFPQDADPRT